MNVLVCASNPGGGQAVAPVAQELTRMGHTVVCVVEGASRDIFMKKKIEYTDAAMIHDEIMNALTREKPFDLFLFGSSIGMTIEKKLLALCRAKGIPSVCVMDFWSNYRARFSRAGNDLYYVPDHIC